MTLDQAPKAASADLAGRLWSVIWWDMCVKSCKKQSMLCPNGLLINKTKTQTEKSSISFKPFNSIDVLLVPARKCGWRKRLAADNHLAQS